MRLQLEGLETRYPSGGGVGPLTLGFDAGIVHLVGPNGSGKSTLLATLATAVERTAGTVRLDGLDPEKDASARARTGYVPTRSLMPGFFTVDEAWRLMAGLRGTPDWDGIPLREALQLPGSVPLSECSTGMRRKADLLAGLAGDPTLLLLDETLANLDPVSLAAVHEAVRDTPLVLVAHHGSLPEGWTSRGTLTLDPTGGVAGCSP